jgi:hypothetical protein
VIRHFTTSSLFFLAFLIGVAPVGAQDTRPGRQLPPGSPFAGGVPDGPPTTETLQLSVADIIRRALEHNLGVLLSEESVSHAGGTRWIALSQLLPNVNAHLAESRQRINLEAFGFSPTAFGLSRAVGPFNNFDARVSLSQSVVDLRATNETRAENHNVEAARHSYRSARDLVVLVAANAYLEALAADARAQSARAQLQTSQALYQQAQDLKQGGIIAGIDVVRAEVRLNGDRLRVTVSQNESREDALSWRASSASRRTAVRTSAPTPNVPVPDMTLESALEQAYKRGPITCGARARESSGSNTRGGLQRAVAIGAVNADYGALGLTASDTVATYTSRVGEHSDLPGRTHAGRIAEPMPICGSGARRPRTCARRSTTTCVRVSRLCRPRRAAAGRHASRASSRTRS